MPSMGDAANKTRHQVSLSSPQTEGGNSKSPRVISPQKHILDCGQSGCSWYPEANQDHYLAFWLPTTMQP